MRTTRPLLGRVLLAIGLLHAVPRRARRRRSSSPFRRSISQRWAIQARPPGSERNRGASWRVDPGPRGVRLTSYETLKADGGVAPAQWKFDGSDWWLEEHGLIMEQPEFPIPPGKYVVTGGREMTAVLTVHAKGNDGVQRWELDQGATLYDVTHLRCRSARYTPAAGGEFVLSGQGADVRLSGRSRGSDAPGRGLQQARLRSSHRDRHGGGQLITHFTAHAPSEVPLRALLPLRLMVGQLILGQLILVRIQERHTSTTAASGT